MSCVAIDIGNTNTNIGFYKNKRVSRVIHTPSDGSESAIISAWLEKNKPERAVITSVIPKVKTRWNRLLESSNTKNILWVDHHCDLGVGIDYPKPEQIGADRLANAAAVAYWIGLPVVVCDFGTALTFDIVIKDRGYIGGVICPGLPLMFDYLSEKTALLPKLKPTHSKSAIGRSTEQAMRIGAERGYRGMVREILLDIKKDLGIRSLSVCATGGHASWVLSKSDIKMHHMKNLTLLGIGRIADLNI